MERAINQAAFPASVAEALRSFFQDVATFLMNRDTPS
jgi:hypothetical protein